MNNAVKIGYSLIAVTVLVLLPLLTLPVPGAEFVFAVVLPYLALAAFFSGFIYRIIRWAQSPVPFNITTVAGQTYTLSFWLAGSGGSSSGSQCAGFDALVGAPVAAYEGNAILYSEFAVGMGVVAPVPEPSTLVLSAVGGLGTLLLFRRRK